MDISTCNIFSTHNKDASKQNKNRNGITTKRFKRKDTDLCKAYTSCIRRLLSSTAILSVLCQPAYTQGLEFLDPPYINQNGESLDIRTPAGHSCRYSTPRGTEVSIGGGYAGNEPVTGIAIRIPLASTSKNCDVMIKLEEAQIKLQQAMNLFEMGLITKEQLEVIAEQHYNIIKDK